jgi:hypothetical protein
MRKNARAPRLVEDANGEVDENYWAQAAADRADNGEGSGMYCPDSGKYERKTTWMCILMT